VPGFLIFAVFGFFRVAGEDDSGLIVGGEDGQYMPGVGGKEPSAFASGQARAAKQSGTT